MNAISLELPFGYDPPDLYCPACGAGLLTEDGTEECPHAVFVHETASGEVSYVAPEYEAAWDTIVDEEPDDEVGEFLKRIDGKHFMKMSVTFGGMACGPVWYTATMVINFAPDQEEEQ